LRIRAVFAAPCLVMAFAARVDAAAPDRVSREPVAWKEIAALPAAPVDHRIPYGPQSLQFGELRLPAGAGPHPVAVVIHGGCWSAGFGLDHIGPASDALRHAGIATWTIEYRRVGDQGGGWPGTFEDVARGIDHVEALARRFQIDTRRVVLVGHSAGGHLALWAAARRNLPVSSPLRAANPLQVRGVVALAGITDLRAYGAAPGGCNAAVAQLLGGTAGDVPERYAEANPIQLLPLRVPQRLVQGGGDPIVPQAQAASFSAEARRQGDDSRVRTIEEAGHFDLIAPFAPAWETVIEEIRALLAPRSTP